ncbi:trigger factor [Ferruginibacter sp. HRS2-29]|uniref:trigger factor n=1 Tax=Ferruginibacter sp. HRS2-29 TaxID=2487334 RepID=UPI0020CFC4C4|nr:trigger factor [Ferruginibacter sp. HRS2-29]MCP9752579.1 trigger factor [Ferruginibacter sp. HRS2-29]
MATVVRENIGLLNDKLTVKISKEDYLPSFEKKLKEYSKTANIPGFRKGMVPAGLIKKMHGAGIFTDELLRTVEKELYTYLNEEKPEIFAQPLPLETDMSKIDMNNPADYEFGFEIGLKPTFEIADVSKAKLTLNKVAVTEEMLDKEIAGMQERGGKVTDIDAVEGEGNTITALFTETDENGAVAEGGISKETALTLGQFNAKTQKALKGKKAGDSITTQLDKAFDKKEIETVLQSLELTEDAAAKTFSVQVVKVGQRENRELNEEFFNEIFPGKGIKTEQELRTELKNEIEAYWAAQSRNQLHDQLYHYLIDETKMEFPEAFLTRWLENGGDKPKTPEQAKEEYPGFSNQLKWTLISDRLITENKLQVTDEELKESMRNEVTRYFGQMNMGEDMSWLDSYIDRMMKDEKQVDATYRRLITDKVFSFVEGNAKPKEKSVTPEELTAMQHNHQH